MAPRLIADRPLPGLNDRRIASANSVSCRAMTFIPLRKGWRAGLALHFQRMPAIGEEFLLCVPKRPSISLLLADVARGFRHLRAEDSEAYSRILLAYLSAVAPVRLPAGN